MFTRTKKNIRDHKEEIESARTIAVNIAALLTNLLNFTEKEDTKKGSK